MSEVTHNTLARFGAVESTHAYTDLIDLFADDAVYYDPLFGPQIGKDQIFGFMQHMEKMVPKSGATIGDWQITAGTDCGFAQWAMTAPNADGIEVPVPGESLYRLRDGLIIGVADYIDPVSYSRLRGEGARAVNTFDAAGSLPGSDSPQGETALALASYVEGLTYAGRWSGHAELVDYAGDQVGWAQWIFHGEHGDFAGWTIQRANGQRRDFFDAVAAHELSTEQSRE